MFLLSVTLLISLASAEIIISQPKALYSLGDELSLEIKIDSIGTGYMNVDLICLSSSSNIYHNVPDSTTISIKRTLTQDYIGSLYGNCHISASYDEEQKSSQIFEISRAIDVTLESDKLNCDAGKTIQVKGTAYRENNQLAGQIYSTFVEVSLPGNITAKDMVKDGQFTVDFAVPDNYHAGIKTLTITVYDEDGKGNVLNSGEATAELNVIQEPSKIGIALDKILLNPGENVSIIPFLYDKAGDAFNSQITLRVTDSEGKIIHESLVQANSEFILITKADAAPGTAKVAAEKDSIKSEKSFEIKALEKVTAEINDGQLIIKNTGNVPYAKNIQIKIGEQTFVKEVDLDVGESKTYDVSAPDGVYNISVNDESMIMNRPGVSLTGNAISLRDTGARLDQIFMNYPIVWIFIAVVLAAALYVWYHKYEGNKRFGMIGGTKEDRIRIEQDRKKGGFEIVKPQAAIDQIVAGEGIKRAEQVVVLHGQKQQASIIAIKVKSEIAGVAKNTLTAALEYGYKNKAVSYSSGNSIILIFSPLLTKTMKNEETAIKAAMDIDSFLKDHNKRFRNDKIVYGLGVNTGELINKIEGKVLQFASINKTISYAKKIADVADETVLLSKEIHEKTPSVKTDRFSAGSMDLFTIKRVVNQQQSQEFINEFLKRNQVSLK